MIGTPFFSGFYSKDSIIEAVEHSHLAGSGFAYFSVVAGVFVTAFYTFRMYFLVFHGKERFGHQRTENRHQKTEHRGQDTEVHTAAHHDEHVQHEEHHGLAHGQKPHESPWVVTLPLVLLAIPSAVIGYFTIGPMLFGSYFRDAIYIAQNHLVMSELQEDFKGPLAMVLHSLTSVPLWLAIAGVASSALFYLKRPDIPEAIQKRFQGVYTLLDNKYYFDRFNDWFFAGGARGLSGFLSKFADKFLIDGLMVNGSANLVGRISMVVRRFQSGYIYHYAFTMIVGVFILLTIRNWF